MKLVSKFSIVLLALVGSLLPSENCINASQLTSNRYQAIDLLIKGQSNMHYGDKRGAISEFTRALKFAPRNALIFKLRALAEQDLSPLLAAKDIEKAIELGDKSLSAFTLRAKFRWSRHDKIGAANDMKRVMSQINHKVGKLAVISKSLSKFAQSRLSLGEVLFRDNTDIHQAIALCNDAIKADSKYVLAYAFRSILEQDPSGTVAREHYAEEMSKCLEQASKDCDAALKLDPKSAFAHACRGELLTQKVYSVRIEIESEKLDSKISPIPKSVQGSFTPASESRIDLAPPRSKLTKGISEKTDNENTNFLFDAVMESIMSHDEYIKRSSKWEQYKLAARLQEKQIDDLRRSAIAEFDRALKINPRLVDVYVKKAELEVELKNFDGACEALTKAVDFSSKDYLLYLRRGDVYFAQGKFAEALADYNTADSQKQKKELAVLEIVKFADPGISPKELIRDNTDVDIRKGNVKSWLGQWEAASHDYDLALKGLEEKKGYDPRALETMYWVYQNRGDARSSLNENRMAEADYDRALEMQHQSKTALLLNHFLVTSATGSNEQAERDIGVVSQDEFSRHLSKYYYTEVPYDRSVTMLGSGLDSLVLKQGLSYARRGNAKVGAHDYGPAIADYSEAIRLMPNCSSFYVLRALAEHFDNFRYSTRSVNDFEKALALNPKCAFAEKQLQAARRELDTRRFQ